LDDGTHGLFSFVETTLPGKKNQMPTTDKTKIKKDFKTQTGCTMEVKRVIALSIEFLN